MLHQAEITGRLGYTGYTQKSEFHQQEQIDFTNKSGFG
jgi:hypothetical protein